MTRYRLPGPLGDSAFRPSFDAGTPTPWRPAQLPGVATSRGSVSWLAVNAAPAGPVVRDVSATEGAAIVAQAALWKDTPYADQPHLQPAGPYQQYNGNRAERGVGGDCSGSTWKIYEAAGLAYSYRASGAWASSVDSAQIPFRRLSAEESLQLGDVLRFSGHLAVFAGEGKMWTARRSGYTNGEYFNRPFTHMAVQYWGNPVLARYRYRVSALPALTAQA